ncbi:hypothetical protein D9615_010186 [Tricholomella constricta]|uniref:Reverse transcriptase domain-containing protein n=1 Tax=Tricholomella constricta TaxID=117010 RepID=A0A8H5GNI0_9AGAR|nr:hypothetical protein D9615_010186 [Tricholomella constricta]
MVEPEAVPPLSRKGASVGTVGCQIMAMLPTSNIPPSPPQTSLPLPLHFKHPSLSLHLLHPSLSLSTSNILPPPPPNILPPQTSSPPPKHPPPLPLSTFHIPPPPQTSIPLPLYLQHPPPPQTPPLPLSTFHIPPSPSTFHIPPSPSPPPTSSPPPPQTPPPPPHPPTSNTPPPLHLSPVFDPLAHAYGIIISLCLDSELLLEILSHDYHMIMIQSLGVQDVAVQGVVIRAAHRPSYGHGRGPQTTIATIFGNARYTMRCWRKFFGGFGLELLKVLGWETPLSLSSAVLDAPAQVATFALVKNPITGFHSTSSNFPGSYTFARITSHYARHQQLFLDMSEDAPSSSLSQFVLVERDPEETRSRAAKFEGLVEDVLAGRLAPSEFVHKLVAEGASLEEGKDYAELLEQRLAQRERSVPSRPVRESAPGDAPNSREPTPDLPEGELGAFRAERTALEEENRRREEAARLQAVDAAGWAILQAKIARLRVDASSGREDHPFDPAALAELLGYAPGPEPVLPPSVLAVAPHLGDLATSIGDPHLNETWKLRRAFSTDKVVDAIINILQTQPLPDPISRSMWRSIVQDHYVDFEKLYATMDRGYDHNDEQSLLLGGFALVRRDQGSAKRGVRTEADWCRVFDTWAKAVGLVYIHRVSELEGYRKVVIELFRASPNTSVAIQFDVDARDRYAKLPFRLDDRVELQTPLFAQVFRGSSSSSGFGKRKATGTWVFAKSRPARVGVSMALAASVVENTGQKTKEPASFSSRLDEQREQDEVAQALAGPKRFVGKRKAESPSLSAPRFRRGYVWSDSSSPHSENISPSALYTETAPPLPMPPSHLLDDPDIKRSLLAMEHHIKVETPFDVDKFESMLHDHPNQPFVESVVTGLREGFWPFDEGDWKAEVADKMDNYSVEDLDLKAIRNFRDKEMKAGRWSEALETTELLAGMKLSPMFVVWQNGKGRVITDHSGSGINDGIPKEAGKVRYDDMHSFGTTLREARRAHPGERFVTWKSDVASAFLNLPAHPIWQLHQVVRVDGVLHIVRRLVFGNRASPRCWCAVSGLLCWLGVRKLRIIGLHVYMDDFFCWDLEGNVIWFHGRYRPRKQVQLLLLWDAVGCPWEDRKQEHGDVLKVIGFWVDANLGTFSLAPDTVSDIIERINEFLSSSRRHPPLRVWQQLGGHLNWLLNVLPWGRPCLTELYRKMTGKSLPSRGIPLNASVVADLSWLRDIIPSAIGVRFIEDGWWRIEDADMVMWADASTSKGLGFVFSNRAFCYELQPCPPGVRIDIFFLELVAILSAFHLAASLPSPPRRLLIWSDSLNAVGALNALRVAESLHNGPLLAIAGIALQTNIDLRVCHIPGTENVRADLLSRLMLEEYGPFAGALEGVLLSALGGSGASRSVRPPVDLRELDSYALHLQVNAIEKSTALGYATGARDYIRFCISANLPLDPTPLTLSRYVAFTSRYVASGPKYLSGARHFLRDIFPDFDANRSHPLVQATVRGSKKIRADPVRRKLPLRVAHLGLFLQKARASGAYDDFLFAVILACCFYACHRSGELVQKDGRGLFNLRKVIRRSSLSFPAGRAQYHLPYHKSDPFYRGTDILFTAQDVADPVALLLEYVVWRDRLHGSRLALFLREDGSHPTRSWFEKRLFAVLGREFGGHSPRAGGATFYAGLGLSEAVIQALGRWSSAAWKIYIRDNPAVRAEQQLASLRGRLRR